MSLWYYTKIFCHSKHEKYNLEVLNLQIITSYSQVLKAASNLLYKAYKQAILVTDEELRKSQFK